MPNLSKPQSYRPAKLSIGREWIITYYAYNPEKQALQRVRTKINHIELAHRRKYASELISKINKQLSSGWSPFENSNENSCRSLKEGLDDFIQSKSKGLRTDTTRTYNSFQRIFLKHIEQKKLDKSNASEFSINDARAFLDYVWKDRDVSPRTYNNYLSFCHSLFKHLQKFGYCLENPFDQFEQKSVYGKLRDPMDRTSREKLKNYLSKNNPGYLLCCLFAYSCLIRRKEITYLKIGWIDWYNQTIRIPEEVSKNGRDQEATVPDHVIQLLKEMDIHNKPSGHYIVSDEFLPGPNKLDPKKISDYWAKVRRALEFPKEYKFYSLRDTGIIELIQSGVDLIDVRDHARHHSLEITNKYAQVAKRCGINSIKRRGAML